jgi:hypothetical protein
MQISRDTIDGPPGSGDDTQVEPDVAMDPNDPSVVTAVFQQGRFQDGGSVAPGFATSQDGGRTWVTDALPNLTRAVGGTFDRASDPVVAFGPDGTAYANTLVFDDNRCTNGLAVQRSDDGGITWGDPVYPQLECEGFNDKNWMTVDTFRRSPFVGRVYVAWDRLSCDHPIVLRWSDDRGETWSPLVNVSGECTGGIGALPVVQPNGDLTVVYQDNGGDVVARTSSDGGATFGPVVLIGENQGNEAADMRTGGLPSAAVDPVTGHLFVSWQDARFREDALNDIVVSRSVDGGASWGSLMVVNPDPPDSLLDHFTPDVAAHDRVVHVVYRTRDTSSPGAMNFVGMGDVVSPDDGSSWSDELVLGPRTDLRFAAEVFFDGTKFLGDYMGVAAAERVAHPVWNRASRPPTPRPYHQTTWSATVLP